MYVGMYSQSKELRVRSLCQNKSRNLTRPMYFVFCRLYPFSPQPPRQCLGPIPVIAILLTNIVSPIRLGGGGFVGSKKKTIVGLLVFNPLCLASIDFSKIPTQREDWSSQFQRHQKIVVFLIKNQVILDYK
jgi:hypothetical protein